MDYEITGMRCAACAARIENSLRKVAGDEATVNFATRRARVPSGIPSSVVVAAVEKVGFEAAPIDPARRQEPAPAAGRERLDFIMSLVLGIPQLVIGMLHLSFPGSGAIQAVLTGLILALPGRGFFVRAAKGLRYGNVGMDTLVAMGSGAAFFLSLGMLLLGRHDYYFEAAAMIVVFVVLGRYMEERARGSALRALDALKGMSARSAVVVDEDGREREAPIEALKAGDRLLVRPGEKAAVDGIVLEGSSTFDESLITGEPFPVARGPGDPVIGATLNNGTSRVLIRATAGAEGSIVARVASLVEEAQATKAKMQRLADRVSFYFVPTVLVLSVLTFLAWRFVEGAPLAAALLPAIAVLVIACPCALGLATPMAILVATGHAARRMILLRGAAGLERTGAVTALVTDKTGTLTEGRPEVVEARYEPGVDQALVLGAAAAAERSSLHPLAMALIVHAESQSHTLPPMTAWEELPGLGVRARIRTTDGELACLIGNLKLMRAEGVAIPPSWEAAAAEERSTVHVALEGKPAALFVIDDKLREGAHDAIAALHRLGVRVIMATGDRAQVAARIGRELGIDEVHAGMTPEGKAALVTTLKSRGETVAMVGDGVNDAPALAVCDVGIAIGTGADVAVEAAHLVLPRGDLSRVAEAVALSGRTVRIMRQNLAWAFLYNSLALPLAALGLLSPLIASGAMALSSLSVVANSLRLRR